MTYELHIMGRASMPVLKHTFTSPSDNMAKEAARKLAALIATDSYWRFDLFNETAPVCAFELSRQAVIRELEI